MRTASSAPFFDLNRSYKYTITKFPTQINGIKNVRYDENIPNTTPFSAAPILGNTKSGRVRLSPKKRTNKNSTMFTTIPTKSCGPEIKKGMRNEEKKRAYWIRRESAIEIKLVRVSPMKLSIPAFSFPKNQAYSML